jgi:hypothetical protein
MKKNYLPRAEAARVIWLNNFAGKIGTYATLFGITPAEVAAIGKMAVIYSYIINLIAQVNTFAKDLTGFKNILSIAPNGATLSALPTFTPAAAPALTQAGIFTYISGIVGRIKSNTANYTENIGKELWIIGEDIEFKESDFKSVISAEAKKDYVVVNFTKKGVDGVNIYSHPIGSTDANAWEKLGMDNHPPYYDSRPLANAGQPEIRAYKVMGVINDEEVGDWSDVVTATYTG